MAIGARNVVSNSTNEQKYEAAGRLQQAVISRFQKRLCEILAPLHFETVIDVGCGEGYLASVLMDRFPHIELSGVDTAPEAVAAAASRCSGAELWTGQIEDLLAHDRQYDLVVCSEVLEHLENPVDGLRALAQCSRRYALLSVPWEPWFQLANFARGKYVGSWGNHPEHIQRWTRGAFVRLASTAFEPVLVDTRFPWTIFLGRAKLVSS